jgi:hypothetical protein
MAISWLQKHFGEYPRLGWGIFATKIKWYFSLCRCAVKGSDRACTFLRIESQLREFTAFFAITAWNHDFTRQLALPSFPQFSMRMSFAIGIIFRDLGLPHCQPNLR